MTNLELAAAQLVQAIANLQRERSDAVKPLTEKLWLLHAEAVELAKANKH